LKGKKSSEKKKRIRVTLVRDTYKQALRGLFVTGTSESRYSVTATADKGKGRLMNQD
jgi:hypothetical protein